MHFAGVTNDSVLKGWRHGFARRGPIDGSLTAGHTRDLDDYVEDAGRHYLVVFPDGTAINAGHTLRK